MTTASPSPVEPNPVERQRDPVCGMNVRVDAARSEGLVDEHAGHTYFFCRTGCLEEFRAEPARFVASHAHAAAPLASTTPEIDDGMRRWYESCACCLSDAYPEVKAALDAEHQGAAPAAAEA